MTQPELSVLCKAHGLKNYSKLKKDERIKLLEEAGVENDKTASVVKSKKASKASASAGADESNDSKESKESKESTDSKKSKKSDTPSVPRKDSVNRKLAKSFNAEKYNAALLKFKEEISVRDILCMLEADIKEFVNSIDPTEAAEFVNKFGIMTVLNFQRAHKNSKLSSKEDNEIYKTLLLYLFVTNEKALDLLVKQVRKEHSKLLNPPAEKKAKVKVGSVKQVDALTSSEEPDEVDEVEDVYEEPEKPVATYEDSDAE
jgi:hypothetical protein